MADSIKGRLFENYPSDIQKGIVLHRFIDSYTDSHPVFRKSTKRLHEKYHHYAGVIIDVFYDHFLAKNWRNYSDETLVDFTNRFYQSLKDNYEFLSERTKGMMPYMIDHNWLVSYQTVEGINRILTQMDGRTKNVSKMRYASNELLEYYDNFESEFNLFFEDLRSESHKKLISL